ncbi:hypothetical protein NM688_g1366 [Phlebia brevispora]|uniref:Uncharacterized protein n=1 Tax=Phlebia brevispora TaxID=194682 RepID=A0ACC1TCC8_9APHY|nr:hypothetical protein NM688_g1366 [Phlebia brevispora]
MMLWAYVLVVFTSPGKARDYVEKGPQPQVESVTPRWWDPEERVGGGPYQYVPENTSSTGNQSGPTLPTSSLGHSALPEGPTEQKDINAGDVTAIPPVTTARAQAEDNKTDNSVTRARSSDESRTRVPMMYTRAPPTSPILRPEYRYCQRDGFVKPPRAHHCRACGTCILKYDHHCPWIGQCVGAHNHKFFVHFLQWAMIFCMWTFATLVAGTVNMNRNSSIDPEFIVVIALAALFILFTSVLLVTHIRLIILNQSTVDTLKAQNMKEREKAVLARMFAWYQFGEKRKMKKKWDDEWGAIDTEGNIWWLGSDRKNWEAVMGTSVWQWFLPIGRSPTDGINWPINPRFDSEGRWRPRREWPAELR